MGGDVWSIDGGTYNSYMHIFEGNDGKISVDVDGEYEFILTLEQALRLRDLLNRYIFKQRGE